MSSSYCKRCGNLYVMITTASDFRFMCERCMIYEQPKDSDTLLHEEEKGVNLTIYRSILATAADDPVNPKVIKTCPKCSWDRARQVRLGEELKLVNTCIKCKHQWLEGTADTD